MEFDNIDKALYLQLQEKTKLYDNHNKEYVFIKTSCPKNLIKGDLIEKIYMFGYECRLDINSKQLNIGSLKEQTVSKLRKKLSWMSCLKPPDKYKNIQFLVILDQNKRFIGIISNVQAKIWHQNPRFFEGTVAKINPVVMDNFIKICELRWDTSNETMAVSTIYDIQTKYLKNIEGHLGNIQRDEFVQYVKEEADEIKDVLNSVMPAIKRMKTKYYLWNTLIGSGVFLFGMLGIFFMRTNFLQNYKF